MQKYGKNRKKEKKERNCRKTIHKHKLYIKKEENERM